jgi:DNA-binding LytR/AlgR family response regulator
MISCVVIDDEPMARLLLAEFIGRIPDLKLEGSFSSALSALPTLQVKPIDVIFLDIQMPDISGIDFIKTLEKRPGIILTTAYAEYALEGFELSVIDYLLKPFEFNRFLKAVNKVTGQIGPRQEPAHSPASGPPYDFIFIKDGTKLVKVDLPSVLYIKGTREYVTIYTRDKKIMSLQTLRSLESNLPKEFVRVHNSYIVYVPAIGTIDKNCLEIGGEVIPIGTTYKKNFFEVVEKYFPGRA